MVERDPILAIVGLIIVSLVAVGAVLLLLRANTTRPQLRDFILGYPANLFPAQELTRTGHLKSLAAVQARLLAVHAQLPRHSELAVWIWSFLRELRPIMDAAYKAANVAKLYNQSSALDHLVREVETIEQEIAERVVKRLLSNEADVDEDSLDAHLAVLRRYARELADTVVARPVAVSR
jgi:hypothetical protein